MLNDRRAPQPESTRESTGPATARRAERSGEIRLDLVGGSRLEASACGVFRAESAGYVTDRLNRLSGGNAVHIRIDCTAASQIDPAILALFDDLATSFTKSGGTLELLLGSTDSPERTATQ